MQQDLMESQLIELKRELTSEPEVHFDSEKVVLEGVYKDELSAHRAKKAWVGLFEANFLLDLDHDYSLATEASLEDTRFYVRCTFLTACGRYAFWRLVNDQTPEIQYLIETAHIPSGATRLEDYIGAPDLKSLGDCEHPLVLGMKSSSERKPRMTSFRKTMLRLKRFLLSL